jgi:hypothetical protein
MSYQLTISTVWNFQDVMNMFQYKTYLPVELSEVFVNKSPSVMVYALRSPAGVSRYK